MKSAYILWQGEKKKVFESWKHIFYTRETFLPLLGATLHHAFLAEEIVTINALFEQKKCSGAQKDNSEINKSIYFISQLGEGPLPKKQEGASL